jgi:hypothetical protein
MDPSTSSQRQQAVGAGTRTPPPVDPTSTQEKQDRVITSSPEAFSPSTPLPEQSSSQKPLPGQPITKITLPSEEYLPQQSLLHQPSPRRPAQASNLQVNVTTPSTPTTPGGTRLERSLNAGFPFLENLLDPDTPIIERILTPTIPLIEHFVTSGPPNISHLRGKDQTKPPAAESIRIQDRRESRQNSTSRQSVTIADEERRQRRLPTLPPVDDVEENNNSTHTERQISENPISPQSRRLSYARSDDGGRFPPLSRAPSNANNLDWVIPVREKVRIIMEAGSSLSH